MVVLGVQDLLRTGESIIANLLARSLGWSENLLSVTEPTSEPGAPVGAGNLLNLIDPPAALRALTTYRTSENGAIWLIATRPNSAS